MVIPVIDGVNTYTNTYIKFGSPPNSDNNYDAFILSGTSNIVGATSYTNQTVVYVWGSSRYAGQIKINDVEYIGGFSYSQAVEIQLSGNYTIYLGHGNYHSAGATD